MKAACISLIGKIIDYAKNTPIWKSIVHALLIIAVSASLASCYVLALHFDTILQTFYHEAPIKELQANVKVIEKIREELRILNVAIKSSRSYVWKYHNGSFDFSGFPFVFQSELVEVVAPGITSEVLNNQRIPVTVSIDMVNDFLKGKCYQYKVIQPIESPLEHILIRRGVEKIYACPLIDVKGRLIGFIGVSYAIVGTDHNSVAFQENIFKELKKYKQQIESIL